MTDTTTTPRRPHHHIRNTAITIACLAVAAGAAVWMIGGGGKDAAVATLDSLKTEAAELKKKATEKADELTLKAEIADLKRQLAAKDSSAPAVPPPALAGVVKAEGGPCALRAVQIPKGGLPAASGTFNIDLKDNVDGLATALAECNKTVKVDAPIPGSTKTARITVTQGVDGWANFMVPTERAARLKVWVFFTPSDWPKENRHWVSEGTFGDHVRLVLKREDPDKAGKVY